MSDALPPLGGSPPHEGGDYLLFILPRDEADASAASEGTLAQHLRYIDCSATSLKNQ